MSRMKASRIILLFLECMVITHGWFVLLKSGLFICFCWSKCIDDGGNVSSVTCMQTCVVDSVHAILLLVFFVGYCC